MGDIFKAIFGGSSQETQSTSKPVDVQADEFKSLRGPLATALGSILGQLTTSVSGPDYTGPLYSPITQPEQDQLTQLQSMTGSGTQRSGVINDTLAGNYLPGQPGANPFLDAAIKAAQRPTLQGLEETLTRSLPGRFTQGGQMVQPQGSSAFDRAAAIATRGAADTIGDIATKISAGEYDAERQRQQDAVTLSRAEVDSSISNLQAQALPRLIQELGIERGLALFQQKTSQLLDILKTIGGVTAPVIGTESQSSGEGESYKGAFSQIFKPV